ncbi:MAG: hypothetical protein R2736_06970 [Solirubrobacterales bacterium]
MDAVDGDHAALAAVRWPRTGGALPHMRTRSKTSLVPAGALVLALSRPPSPCDLLGRPPGKVDADKTPARAADLCIGEQRGADACRPARLAAPPAACTVKGAIGDVTISARPAQTVTFRVATTPRAFGQITIDGAANITIDHARVTDSTSLPESPGGHHSTTNNVRLTRLTIGGTPTARTMPAALVWIGAGNDNITIEHSELA